MRLSVLALILAGCGGMGGVQVGPGDMASADAAQFGQLPLADMAQGAAGGDMASDQDMAQAQTPPADLAQPAPDLAPSCSGTWVRVTYTQGATLQHKIICAASVPAGTGAQGEPCATVVDEADQTQYGGGCVVGASMFADCYGGSCH